MNCSVAHWWQDRFALYIGIIILAALSELNILSLDWIIILVGIVIAFSLMAVWTIRNR
jgi:hypothetical protein